MFEIIFLLIAKVKELLFKIALYILDSLPPHTRHHKVQHDSNVLSLAEIQKQNVKNLSHLINDSRPEFLTWSGLKLTKVCVLMELNAYSSFTL